MATVKILVEGYAREEGEEVFASPSTVLIEDSGKKVLVDPGTNKDLLLAALEKEGIKPEDIDILFLSHYHIDHTLNIRLFLNTPIYDGNTIYEGDKESFYENVIPGTTIQVIPTPGHAAEHCSLLVETDEGKVCIAEDVFWWMDGEQKTDRESLLSLKDPYVQDEQALLESRKKLLEVSDWIIPGHGKKFKIKN